MKGSKTMVSVLVVILINLVFLSFINRVEKHLNRYETMFCRDVRAELGMFAYPSEIEKRREKLNRKKSKF